MTTTNRLDDMLGALADTACAAVFDSDGRLTDGWRDRLRDDLAVTLRAQVPRQGGSRAAADRLDPEKIREDAARLVYEREVTELPNALTNLVADLLMQVREADQREEWIREGYSADVRRTWQMMEDAQRENGELRHALRLVKRATRHVKVGRE